MARWVERGTPDLGIVGSSPMFELGHSVVQQTLSVAHGAMCPVLSLEAAP